MIRLMAAVAVAFAAILLAPAGSAGQVAVRRTLEYAPAPVDNPLKGLVPYAGDVRDKFPHSMEFNYLPLSALVVGENKYDWTPLEKMLGEIAGRGHQAVFRVYLEYPGQKSGIPGYLIQNGLTVHRWKNTNTAPLPPSDEETPDYADPRLRTCLRRFIAALGKRYDGDARIGFLTAGLLGSWGEWHTYPRNDLWASKAVQTEVLDAYQAAFKTTPVLLRYPAGENDGAQAANADRPFGYHDDSFAWATLDTGNKNDGWFFLPAMKRAGKNALAKWKTQPIGGEIRPEAWGRVFDPDPGLAQIQDFAQCVQQTHATWLLDTGMFRDTPSPAGRRERAEQQVRKMGYEFHVPAVKLQHKGKTLRVAVEIENRGVAPFYYDWPAEFALLSRGGAPEKTFAGTGKLTHLLPGSPVRVWNERFNVAGVAPGRYQLALRVPNRLPGGLPLRFANKTQNPHSPGWLILTTVTIP